MKTLTIISTHATLAEAVKAAKLDLSYNQAEADYKIRMADEKPRIEFTKTERAFVVAGEKVPEVWYQYSCTGEGDSVNPPGVRMLRRFEPFFSCMSDSPLQVGIVDIDGGRVTVTSIRIMKDKAGRSEAAELCNQSAAFVIL